MNSRPATPSDAPEIASIYSKGIAERVATFETEPKRPEDIAHWFTSGLPVVVVEVNQKVIAFAAAQVYSARPCYRTIAEFSVYVDAEHRGVGAGSAAMAALIDECKQAGIHKLTSRIFVENLPSLRLMESLGFRTVGVHQNHAKLDGVWRNVVTVERIITENL